MNKDKFQGGGKRRKRRRDLKINEKRKGLLKGRGRLQSESRLI